MELKSPLALYICAGVAAVFVIATFINIRLKRKYKGERIRVLDCERYISNRRESGS